LRWLKRKKRLPGQAMERIPIMSSIRFPKLTFWRSVVAIIFLAGAYAAYARFALGFERSTNLADSQPWGLWVGLGTLCGVGISAGGFALAAAVYLLGFERYRPVVRAAVLLSFLGYLTVVVGMMYELGLPWRIWHPIVMWNRRSVLFEVSWCVMLYTTVLSLEFSPSLVEKIPWVRLRDWYLKWHHHVLIALVLIGAILSSLHQSFLGGLYLLAKGKVDPLWYSPYLPTLFYLSAVPAGLSATIMAVYLCNRSLNARVDPRLLSEMSQIIAPMLYIYALLRGIDLATHGAAGYLFRWREESLLFWFEIGLFVLAPVFLLSQTKVRNSPNALYGTCALVVMGFMANRLNVSITAFQASSGFYYVPKWTEFALTLATVTAAGVAFHYAVRYLEILPRSVPVKNWMTTHSATA
jgi:Ni/Fe-hydrogenase subunit HybB-like protein